MAKIDRLGWAAGMCIDAHGVRIGIRVNQPETLEWFEPLLPPGWKPAKSPFVDMIYSFIVGGQSPNSQVKRFHILYLASSRLTRTMKLEEVYKAFELDVRYKVAYQARRRVYIHAGVVGWQGRAILLPGVSTSGKSTLTAALLRAGATYYSDEFAVLDPQGRVHPYAQPLVLESEEGKPQRFPVKNVGGVPGVKPLPVGLIVFSQYQSGSRWRPRTLSPGQGMLKLLKHTLPTREKPKTVLPVLRRVVSGAHILQGRRGEAEEVAKLLLEQAEDDRMTR